MPDLANLDGGHMEEPLRLKEDMIERVAAAMKARASDGWGNLNSFEPVLVGCLGDGWKIFAAEAIAAMRDPTDIMRIRGMEALYPKADALPSTIYIAMIDAALQANKVSGP